MPGLLGVPPSPAFPPWLSRGRKARVSSKLSRSVSPVTDPPLVPKIEISLFALLNISRSRLMLVPVLLPIKGSSNKLLSLTWKSLGVPKCAPVLDGLKRVRGPRPTSFALRRTLRTDGSPHYGRVMGPSYPLLSICVAPLPLFILPFSLPRLLTPLFLPLSLPIYHLPFHLRKLLSVRAISLLKSVL